MKIVVYGATGMVGSAVVEAAVRRGHRVVAVSRRGAQVEGATSVAADLGDVDRFAEITAGADAVVVAVTDRSGAEGAEHVVQAHRDLVASRPGVRLVVVGGAGALEVDGGLLKDQPGFPEAYRPEAETFTTVLQVYRDADGVDWTMVAPSPEIAPGERTGYLLGTDRPAGDRVSVADFADAIVDELENPAHRGTRFTVASR